MPNYIYKFLLDKNGQIVYPRTPLSAIDMTTTNGIQISGDTMSVVFATKEQIARGESGHIISADGLKEALEAYGDTMYTAGGGIGIEGGTIFAKPAPILSVLDGTKDRADAITNAVLNGALNLGRAVDVTTLDGVNRNTFTSASPYDEYIGPEGSQIKEDCIQLTRTSPTTNSTYYYGWNPIPKFGYDSAGNPLKYLIMADVQNRGTASITATVGMEADANIGAIAGVDYTATLPSVDDNGEMWIRLASTYTVEAAGGFYAKASSTAALDIRLKHFMVFEVTALSDEAIYALATMEHPEDVYAKYLVKKDAVCPWINIINMQYSAAVTIGAGLSYKLIANDGNDHTLMVDTFPENAYGRDAFITLFVGDAEHILVQSPLVLMDPLTPNAVNNCTIKFRDGYARIYVTDTDYGYTVTVTSGSTDGSLKYGLVSTTEEYIVIANQLDGERISFDGAAASAGRKTNILGHGTDKTILTGSVSLTPTVEMHALSLADVNVTGGTMIVPKGVEVMSGASLTASGGSAVFNGGKVVSGATVYTGEGNIVASNMLLDGTVIVESGAFVAQNVVGNNGIIDLNRKNIAISASTETIDISNCSITNGYSTAISAGRGVVTLHDCMISGNTSTQCTAMLVDRGSAYLYGCVISDNVGGSYSIRLNQQAARLYISGCTFGVDNDIIIAENNARVTIDGYNALPIRITNGTRSGYVRISSGAILDLTNNAYTTPFTPGGNVTFPVEGATIYPSAGSAAAVTVAGGTFTAIANGTVTSGGSTYTAHLLGPVYASANETISGSGGVVIDLDKTALPQKTGVTYSNVIITNGKTNGDTQPCGNGYTNTFRAVTVTSCPQFLNVQGAGVCTCDSVTFGSGITRAMFLYGGNALFSNCNLLNGYIQLFTKETLYSSGALTLAGDTKVYTEIYENTTASNTKSTSIIISPNTVLDLTSNASSIPISAGLGVTINGGMTVKYQHDSANNLLPNSSSYSITGATFTVPSLRNDNVIDLTGTYIYASGGASARITGVTVTGGTPHNVTNGGIIHTLKNGVHEFKDVTFSGNIINDARWLATLSSGTIVNISNCKLINNSTTASRTGQTALYIRHGGTVTITDFRAENDIGKNYAGVMIEGVTTCTITGATMRNLTAGVTPGIRLAFTSSATLTSCSLLGCNPGSSDNIRYRSLAQGTGSTTISNCSIDGILQDAGTITLVGSNAICRVLRNSVSNTQGLLKIVADSILDMTGTPFDLPINTLEGIIVADGDVNKSCTVINSAGTPISITGGTYLTIAKDGTATRAT